MNEFEDYMYHRVSQEMSSWNDEEAKDIYLVRLYVGLVDDDVRQGMIAGPEYSTTKILKERGFQTDDKWDAPAAYRSKFALCEPIVEAWGNQDRADPNGVRLRDEYLTGIGLLMTEAEYQRFGELYTKKLWNGRGGHGVFTEEDAAEAALIDDRLEQIGEAFVDAVGRVVQRLHDENVVERVCGRTIPVVLELSNDIDTLSAYTLQLVKRVNPKGAADEYFAFHASQIGLTE